MPEAGERYESLSQHVAVLAAVIYFALRAFAVPMSWRILLTLILIWLYTLVAGALLRRSGPGS